MGDRRIIVDKKNISQQIRTTFGLDKVPFLAVDDDLLYLAFTPTCTDDKRFLPRALKKSLLLKYKVCNHQTLEYYGDRILYTILVDVMYDLLGISNDPGFLSRFIEKLSDNRILTDLMLNKDACRLVRSSDYEIKNVSTKFHNICADSFEALIGALFVHFKNENYIEIIKKWLLQNTNMPDVIRENLNNIVANVYTPTDKEEILKRIAVKKQKSLEDLRALRTDFSLEEYETFRELIEKENQVLTQDFASKTILIDENENLQTVYSRFQWKYVAPVFDVELRHYFVVGYPNGKEKIIGSGETPEDAEIDALQYLNLLGFMIWTRKIPKWYRH